MSVVEERALALDARQREVVARTYGGPAVLCGRPGTGKTVVALHRLAARPPGRLLYLTAAPGLARVQAAAYRGLAGAASARFASVREWAADHVLRRGVPGGDPVAAALGLVPLPRYDFVVVDEAQALSTSELRLAHALGGANLHLVSAVPAARWLPGSGITLDGRVDTLRVNYRNCAAVLAVARAFDADAGRVAEPHVRHAGTAMRYLASCPDDQDAELVAALQSCPVPAVDVALLTAGRASAAHYRRVLQAAQIPAVDLGAHLGRRVAAVKVGSLEHARGLEFAAVFVPDVRAGSTADALAAVTRAREYVWTGNVLDPGRHG